MTAVDIAGSIVIVDDDATERLILSRVFAMSHLRNPITEFASGRSFLESLEGAEPSAVALVMMDINMPGLSGFETLALLRADSTHGDQLVAVMVPTLESRADIERANEFGADLCIAKQSGIAKYVETINQNFEPNTG